MYKLIITVIVLQFFLIAGSCYSQNVSDSLALKKQNDTILLTDGNIIISSFIDTTGGIFKYSELKRPAKIRKLNTDEVFSIRNNTGETILYKPDSIDNNYSLDEMRYFMAGHRDGRKTKMAYTPFIANMLLSAGVGLTRNFFAPLAPVVFTAVLTLPKIKIRKENVSNPDYLNSEAYATGYKQEAYKKKRVQTILGGGIGLVAGMVTSFILKSNGIDVMK
jgi:hypothetical protein